MNILQKAIRGAKDVALRRSDTEILVRDATNNEQWGPNGSDMRQIADLTYSPTDYTEIMTTLWERLEDSGKNWRHVYKGLLVIDYLIKNGSDRVVQECKFRILAIKTLSEFQYIDEEEKDQGLSVRQRAKAIVELLNDDKRLTSERQQAAKTRDKFGQAISSDSGFQQSHVYQRGSGRAPVSGYYGSSPYPSSSTTSPRTTTSPNSTQQRGGDHDSSSSSEDEAPARTSSRKTASPKKARSKKTSTSATATPQADLLGFGDSAQDFDPRGKAAAPAAAPNTIDIFGAPVAAQPQQQPVQPPQQSLPGNPQRLPDGRLMVQGHVITEQQYRDYLAFLQQQQMRQSAAPQQASQQPPQQQPQSAFIQHPVPQQQQQTSMFFPTHQPTNMPPATMSTPTTSSNSNDDDWNDFTGAKSPSLTPSTSASASSAAKPKDKFDDLLDLSALSVSSTTPTRPASSEPTLAQLQAQRQAQAQQQASFGYQPSNGFGQQPSAFGNGYAQPQQQQQQNGFFF